MDLADTRPKFLHCAGPNCGKRFKVKPRGAIGLYCSDTCKAATFRAKQPKPEPKLRVPKPPKPSLEERVAVAVVELLIERGVITFPPEPEPDQK